MLVNKICSYQLRILHKMSQNEIIEFIILIKKVKWFKKKIDK